MLKIITYFLLTSLLFCSCASGRKATESNRFRTDQPASEIVKSTVSKNLTITGFFIQKGRITTISQDSRVTLIFTMKYNKNGSYLISLRSRTGIEAFRVFLSKDTILVNDRLNHQLLYGRKGDFEYISGLPQELLRYSVGDLYINKPFITGPCTNNELKISDFLEGLVINSVIDCRFEKVKSVIVNTGDPLNNVKISYSKYREDSYSIPRTIEINDASRRIRILIQIDKYVAPWAGDFEFIPGSDYTARPLR